MSAQAPPLSLKQLGRELGSQGIAVTTIGLGLDYSEELMTRMALASDGNHAFVENPEQLADIFNKEFGDVLSVVGQDVDIEIICPDGVTPLRGLGRDVKVDGRRVSFRLNQIGGKQERYLVIELDIAKGKAQGSAAIADVNVSYLDPKTKARAKIAAQAQVSFSSSSEEATRSANASVAADVAAQLANECSERPFWRGMRARSRMPSSSLSRMRPPYAPKPAAFRRSRRPQPRHCASSRTRTKPTRRRFRAKTGTRNANP